MAMRVHNIYIYNLIDSICKMSLVLDLRGANKLSACTNKIFIKYKSLRRKVCALQSFLYYVQTGPT